MDKDKNKNKSRSEMLAAGRKKLQQFRQKDSKSSGSHVKSSKKSVKSEQPDGDVATPAAEPQDSVHISESEIKPGNFDSNAGLIDSVSPESTAPIVNTMLVHGQHETLGDVIDETCNSRFPVEGSEIDEAVCKPSLDKDHFVINDGENPMAVESEVQRVTDSGTCEVATSAGKEEPMLATGSLPVDFSAPLFVDGVSHGRESINIEDQINLLSSEQDLSDALLTQAREVKEVDSSGLKQLDVISGIFKEEELPALSKLPEPADNFTEVAVGTSIMGSTCETEPLGASLVAGNELGKFSATMGMNTDEISAVAPDESDQQRENLAVTSSEEERIRSSDSRNYTEEEIQPGATKHDDIPEGESFSKTLGTKTINLFGRGNVSTADEGNSISLSQLAHLLKGLDEDEFRFLLKSKDSGINSFLESPGSLLVPEHDFSDVLESYKEQIYPMIITHDISTLQLMEQSKLEKAFDHQSQQFDDKISMLSTSLTEVCETNKCLSEELAQYRSELQTVTSERQELRHQLQTATAEVTDFSARVHELQGELERSQGDFSIELGDCKSLLNSLQAENSNLSGNLTSTMEEWKKVEEELTKCKSLVADVQAKNGELSGSLGLVTEDRTKLEVAKEHILGENETLSSQLADCYRLVEAFQVEKANASETLASMTGDMKKLEEEKQYYICESDRLRSELAECQSQLKTLQAENANFIEGISLVTDDRSKLEKEKGYLISENKELSSKLHVHQELLSVSQAECLQLEADLKETKLWVDQLSEENVFLGCSLEIHQGKIRETHNMQNQLALESREVSNHIESRDLSNPDHYTITGNDDSRQMSDKQGGETSFPLLEGIPLSYGYAGDEATKKLDQSVYIDVPGFVDLSGRLEKADQVIMKLEKAIKEMHSHSISLSRSVSKVSASGVSKLIQAFESKAHLEDGDVEENISTEGMSIEDPFMSSKEQTKKLRDLLKELQLEAVNASEVFKGETNDKEVANIAYKELKIQYDSISKHTDKLEALNIELQVQFEYVKQQVCNAENKNRELLVFYESLKQEYISLKSQNTELGKRLNDFHLRINELNAQLVEFQQSYEGSASKMCNQIENLRREVTENLEVACTDHEAISSSYNEAIEQLNTLQGKNELAVDVLNKIYDNLRKRVVDSHVFLQHGESKFQNDELLDSLALSKYEDLLEQLGTFLGETVLLKLENTKLNQELVSRNNDMDDLKARCLDLNVVLKLAADVEAVVMSENLKINLDEPPLLRLDSSVGFLLQRYIEADDKVKCVSEELALKESAFSELQEKVNQLDSLNLSQKNDIVDLTESLKKAEEALVAVRSQVLEKTLEVEQSEQRVSSIREKLSIAVGKGKGLIVQRDHLKQSLTEASFKLERSSHELQLKDDRLHEMEEKLKMYSEAGERVEALESELSYIRNSATALRESFLLKDSVIQRIEEILEDLELPENFHSRDVIEKVDWLARSVCGNSLPQIDWDQKSSVEGGSYSDAGFVVTDGWKDDTHPNSNSGDDLRRKYEELEGKFYGLAEQNEMLEQSLMERNILVQRWEEVLEKINVSTQVRSMDPEDRIAWLGNELSEARQYANALQQNIDNLESQCRTLTSDLEGTQKKLHDVEAALEVVTHDKGHLSRSIETLTVEHEKLSDLAAQFELANDKLQNELISLQEKLAQNQFHKQQVDEIEGEIVRLQDLVSNALKDSATKDLVSGESSIKCLEGLLIKLVDKYASLCTEKPVLGSDVDATLDEVRNREILDAENSEVLFLKNELEVALSDVMRLKEEEHNNMENRQSLGSEVEALKKKMEELQELLIQEEKKLSSTREKLNVAVRKGKSLVQQRDSMKQTIEEMNNEIVSLKSVISHQESIVSHFEQKIKDLSTYPEKVVRLESENLSLKDHLIETGHLLNEKGHTLAMVLDTVADIDVGGGYSSHGDPVVKLKQLGKLCSELQAAVNSSEQESRKSKRAAELLVEELNEVQERNDSLQEKLANASSELLALSKDRDMTHAAKLEALSRLENLSFVHSREKKNEDAAFMALKSMVHKFRGSFFEANNLLASVLFKDLDILQNLDAYMELCLKPNAAANVAAVPLVNIRGDISSYLDKKENFLAEDFESNIKEDYYDGREVYEACRDVGHDLLGFVTEISLLKEKLQKHSISLDEKAGKLYTVVDNIHKEFISQTESLVALKKDIVSFDSIEKEKDIENAVLRKSISLLFEACATSIIEIENRKSHLFGDNSTAGDLGMQLKSVAAAAVNGKLILSGPTLISSQEQIRALADGLSMLVKELINMEAEIIEGKQQELKATIANLYKELQEKDMQRDRICMELASQIREAEAAAKQYSIDFQSSKSRVHDLEMCIEEVEEERDSLKQRVKELQDREVTSVELQEKVRSMTETVAAKDQEIESLMQALDEEEMQMEELANKNLELEKVVLQKNIDLENLEASRGKAMKKLSITVSKFDELHNLSASLLAEVEKLQSQLQERDSEISFLRQEVTRCTNDVLFTSQLSNKPNSDELQALLTWLGAVVSRVQGHDLHLDEEGSQIHEFKEMLQNQVTSIIAELEDLRTMAQSKDTLIQIERGRVEELTRKGDNLENSLRQMETQLKIMKNARDSGETSTSPEIIEVEPAINQWTGTSIAPKVRSLRKVNNDQVAIAIDADLDSSRVEDEDDDKVHGFKSLTTSRIVPRFTRPVTDMIDGLWVSCDRALMRQPALRLGIILYWAVLHALFATFAV